MSDGADRCKQQIWSTATSFGRFVRCSRSAKRDGYCAIHHPDAVAKREQKSRENAERKQENSIFARYMRCLEREQKQKEVINRLADALKQIIAISDRKHDAWDNAKALLAELETERQS